MKLKITVGVGIVVSLSLIPIPYTAAPQWSFHVVDEAGRPLPGVTARMTWENYSVENVSHEQDMVSNQDGDAVFPSRRAFASLVRRIF
jgi:hypothetical protein